ncbi:MAG: hypothetical protein DWQ37_19375 [Planctomycetota bacterium]|nr:MAG: hypothetical protein DWQ37_19375 [Planctomycetota bacterium]
MSALALISDLMMQSQVSGAASRLDLDLAAVSSERALLAKAADAPPSLVIVDLSHPGLDPAALMEQLRPHLAEGARTVAFGPHVHKARLAAATAAGFDQVVSRGQFHAEMDSLLQATSGQRPSAE